MTETEARQLAGVFATADGECRYCAMDLAEEMAKHDPGHDWQALTEAAITTRRC